MFVQFIQIERCFISRCKIQPQKTTASVAGRRPVDFEYLHGSDGLMGVFADDCKADIHPPVIFAEPEGNRFGHFGEGLTAEPVCTPVGIKQRLCPGVGIAFQQIIGILRTDKTQKEVCCLQDRTIQIGVVTAKMNQPDNLCFCTQLIVITFQSVRVVIVDPVCVIGFQALQQSRPAILSGIAVEGPVACIRQQIPVTGKVRTFITAFQTSCRSTVADAAAAVRSLCYRLAAGAAFFAAENAGQAADGQSLFSIIIHIIISFLKRG